MNREEYDQVLPVYHRLQEAWACLKGADDSAKSAQIDRYCPVRVEIHRALAAVNEALAEVEEELYLQAEIVRSGR